MRPKLNLTNLDMLAVEREYCRRSLANFAKRAWHIMEPSTPLVWGWALDVICEHLEAVHYGQLKRLCINVPPGCMKSLLLNVLFPAWEWGPRSMPAKRYLGTAHKQDLAVRDSTKCRRLIESGWYQKLWPVHLTTDQNQKTKFENTSTGFREAMAFTSLTGSRADRVLIDDPHSVNKANSRAHLEADVREFREALPSRVNNEESAIIIIMQRLAVGDVTDIAAEIGYQRLVLPMRYERGRSIWTVGAGDPRQEEGGLLFPERYSEEAVKMLETSLQSYGAASQLQQRPTARGGNIIRGEWFGLWEVLPPIKYRMMFADTAQKAKEHNDYSVFQCWGAGDDGRAYLLDQIRGKWEAPELERRAVAFWQKHHAEEGHGALRKMMIEDKASGTGLIQTLKTKNRIPVGAIQRGNDKYSRCMDALPHIESGNVVLPADAPWLIDLIGEAEGFTATDTHANDDQLDPMFDAIEHLVGAKKQIERPPIVVANVGSRNYF